MTTPRKAETLSILQRSRVSAIIRTDSEDQARQAMRAAVDGGFRVVEFTLTTPGAAALISEFAAMPEILVGAGTVLTVEQARQAVRAGARFIVSPVCDPAVIAEANDLGAVSVPGTFTPTEMLAAHNAGADLVKLFPAPGIGPAYVRSILGPLPFLRIFPTNGITFENFQDYLDAGAFGVGFVGDLFASGDVSAGRFEPVRRRAERIIDGLSDSPFAPPD